MELLRYTKILEYASKEDISMRSMTGFGSSTASDGIRSVTIEMKAVNQRFLELNIRMPHGYLALEDALRRGIKDVLRRGKVDVFVTVTELAPEAPQITVNEAMVGACKDALDRVNAKFFPGATTSLNQLASLTKDWFVEEPPRIDTDAAWPVFQEALQGALAGMVAMRDKEGANIEKDLLARVDTMAGLVEEIASRKEDIMARYQERLEKRILALLEKADRVPDEDRLLQEVAIYADKVDFTEEIVRFRSHVVQLKGLLESAGDVGRKLDFLIQEMNRETNTIGSKANDLDVTEHVLQLKNEIEKIREQVQNIE